MSAVAILGSGMVTGVGLDAASSCAAIRAAVTGFVETRFMFASEWLIGCAVPLDDTWRGREKQLRMLVLALRECLAATEGVALREVPVYLALAEEGRPGRLDRLDASLLHDAGDRLGEPIHAASAVFGDGRTGGARALDEARRAVLAGAPFAIAAGVDSYLVGQTLHDLEKERRILTADNSDGFIPGEAAGAVLVGAPSPTPAAPELRCLGIGFGHESAAVGSDQPLRGDGLAQAFRAALADGDTSWDEFDYQIGALSGEQYGFKEAALAAARTIRPVKHGFDLWHPSDCIGEVGAAIVPCMLGVALAAARKGYAPGAGVLCHAADDDGRRAAMVLRDGAARR